MKKIIVLAVAAMVTTNVANAQVDQAARQLACKGLKDAVDKNIKSTENPKLGAKSATWMKLADSYLDHAQQCGEDSMAAKKAYDIYQKALEIDAAAGGKSTKDIKEAISGKKMTSTLLQQGAVYYNANNLTGAKTMFDLSSRLNPKDTTAALYAGIVNQRLQNNNEAKADFQRYLDGGAKDPGIYYTYAQILKSEKKYDEAMALLKKGLEKNPNNKDLQGEIINTHIISGNIDGAIENLSELVKSDPSNTSNMTNLGILYDNKASDYNNKINELKREAEKNNTTKLKAQLSKEELTIGDFDNEVARLKKDAKNAAVNKKKIAELLSRKTSTQSSIESLKKDIADKEAMGANSNLNTQIEDLTTKQKAARAKAYEIYTKVIANDPKNYDANYNMAVMHFNDAVEIKKTIDNMDMKTYNATGKDVEQKACAEFSKSKPFFQQCQTINPNDGFVNETLSQLEKILEPCNK